MREIEIKARVRDKASLIDRIREQGIALSDPVTHHDRVFGAAGVDGDNGDNAAPWLRIRTEIKDGLQRYIFTFKKSVTN